MGSFHALRFGYAPVVLYFVDFPESPFLKLSF